LFAALPIPAGASGLDAFARRHGTDAARLRRLNPVFGNGSFGNAPRDRRVLAPAGITASTTLVAALGAAPALPVATASGGFLNEAPADAVAIVAPTGRVHTVARGESAWVIARRYGVRLDELLSRNRLPANPV